jgi:hypothetical protein
MKGGSCRKPINCSNNENSMVYKKREFQLDDDEALTTRDTVYQKSPAKAIFKDK